MREQTTVLVNTIVRALPQDVIIFYKISKKDNFVKSTGLQISKKSSLIRRKDFLDMSQDCFFRNMEILGW